MAPFFFALRKVPWLMVAASEVSNALLLNSGVQANCDLASACSSAED